MPPRHLRCQRASRSLAAALLANVLWALAAIANAQTNAAPPSAGADVSPAERAKRDADKVFQWIRIMSDKPRKPGAGVTPGDKPGAGSPAPTKVATKPAARPPENPIVEKTEPVAPTLVQQTVPMTTAIGSAETASAAAKPESVTNVASLAASSPMSEAPSVGVEQDAALVPVVKTDPDFPANLMRSLRKGMVQVSFTVQPDGSVAQARAVSSTNPRLVSAAVATVSQWRFQPLHHPQEAVVDLGFNLD